jgi:hypothetical protein
METRPVVLEGLIADLRRVECWLTQSLGVSVENPGHRELADPFSPPDDLNDLKNAIDRIRPLLWVFLTRQNEARDLNNQKKAPASVRTLMEDALSISERYMGNGE